MLLKSLLKERHGGQLEEPLGNEGRSLQLGSSTTCGLGDFCPASVRGGLGSSKNF